MLHTDATPYISEIIINCEFFKSVDLFQRDWKQLMFGVHEWKRGRDLSFSQQHFSLFLDELEVSSSLWEMAEPDSL